MDSVAASRLRVAVITALALLTAAALAACGSSWSPSGAPSWSPTMSAAPIPIVKPGQQLPEWSQILALFAYDRSEPLATQLGTFDTFKKFDMTFTPIAFAVNGRFATGYLVMPRGEGPFPAVIYAPGNPGSVTATWGEDAASLAKQGYAALLLDEVTGFGSDWSKLQPMVVARTFRDYVIQERRGIDLLETMPKIDASRIGFVGFSTGAVAGAILSGVDQRVRAFAFSGVHETVQGADVAFDAEIALLNPPLFLSHNEDSAFFFTWGKTGDAASPDVQKRFVAAVGANATVFQHWGAHQVTPDSREALDAWLLRSL
jgi:dienelactone hydrolase